MSQSPPDHNSPRKLAYESPEDERPATASPTEAELEQNIPTIKKLDASPVLAEHDPYSAFRLPMFRVFIASLMLATLGGQIMSIAVQWEIAVRTHSALTLGLLGGLQALPIILLALPAGHVGDRFSRKKVLVVTQLMLVVCAIGLAALAYFAGHWSHYIGAMFVIVLINAVALSFGRPARQAFLPQLIPKEIFSNAITWNSTIFELASITGPTVGGVLIAMAHTSVVPALLASALCTIVCFVMTLLLPSIPPSNRGEPMTVKTLLAGVRFVMSNNLLLSAMTLDLFAVLFGGATYLLPLFATSVLHVGSFGFGCLRAAPSVGAVLMAIIIAHLPPMKHAGRSLLIAVTGFGLATIVFGISKSFWLSMSMLFLTGAFDNVSVVVRHTLVQLLTPDSMRGRVSAVNQVFIGSSNELGGLESGVAAALLGLTASVVLGGVGTIVVVSAVAFAWPQLRKFGSLQGEP